MEILNNKNNVLIIKEKKLAFFENKPSEMISILKFYSYNTYIASYEKENKKLILNDNFWKYSQTTIKQFKNFVNEYTHLLYTTKKEFEKMIKNNNDIVIL